MDKLLHRLIDTEPSWITKKAMHILVRRGYMDEVRDAYETAWGANDDE